MTDQKINLPKTYEAKSVESAIYERWEKENRFKPTAAEGQPFVISLPPPNATGKLHIGHAMMLAIEDLMIRYHRLKGDETLWVPGTDHAAIATQNVVERKVWDEEKKTRHDLGRDELLKRIVRFVEQSRNTIRNQLRRMGSSLDWSRERYTLDPGLSRCVRMVFKIMYDDGLIYRGNRIVNWCVRCQSTLADDEVKYKTEKGKLYWIKYGPFVLATARPETKLGDTAVAVHPSDKRYQKHIGKKYQIPGVLGPFEVTVVADKEVDPGFGSGVIKVTPAHDFTDFDIAERHGVSMKQVIGEDGRMMSNTGKYAGLTTAECRQQIVKDMKAKGLIDKIEDEYKHNVALCDRCDSVIEPLPKLQWFVNVNKTFRLRQNTLDKWSKGDKVTLKELMAHAVKSKQITIIPGRFEKTYFHWIDNLRDWCISRQIWYGHQIPVWYREKIKRQKAKGKNANQNAKIEKNEQEIYVGIEPPNGKNWEQDPDTLDTWFSSGLWTFSTLLKQSSSATNLADWQKESSDLKSYHPTSVLETGYDIIFNWVARMVLMTTYALGEIPFHNVYLHGLVRDEQGRKMSKSLGNVIDPLDMIDKYGADAVRLSLVIGTTPGNDIRLYDEKIAGYRNFVNKLWNISRYILTTTEPADESPAPKTLADRWIISELEKLKRITSDHIENYRFSPAGEALYDFTWRKLADWYVEIAKIEGGKDTILRGILKELLILWHPYTPFVTEHIWQLTESPDKPLIISKWPQVNDTKIDLNIHQQFGIIQNVVTAIRDIRQEVKTRERVAVHIVTNEHKKLLASEQSIVETLGRATFDLSDTIPDNVIKRVLTDITVYTTEKGNAKNKKRAAQKRDELERYTAALRDRLNNEEFRSRAPANIIAKEEARLKEYEKRLKQLV